MSQMLTRLFGKRQFNYCVMDIECTDWTDLKCVGFFDGNHYQFFKTMRQFLDVFLSKPYEGWRCFAHFGGGYDFNFVLKELQSLPNIHYKILSNGGASFISLWKKSDPRVRWYFVDSYKLLPRKQADLAFSFDVVHKKMEEVNRSRIGDLSDEELYKYNEHDCRGLHEILKKFEGWFDKYDVPLKTTIASQAMATYRRTMPLAIPVLSPLVEDFVRKGFYGGRVEVFKMRCRENIHIYDIRSLYPSVMRLYSMPVGKAVHVSRYINDSIGFYRASVAMPKVYVPSLPFRMLHKLIFPVGKWDGIYSSAELDYARLLGAEVRIREGYVFANEYIFDRYVDDFFKLKESSDGTTRQIAKLLLNSLFGKFAERRKKEVIIHSDDLSEIVGAKPYKEEFNLWTKETVSHANFIIPSISAWITSCARIELMKWLMKAGEDNIYYADTDSIFSSKKLPTGNGLGELKLESEADDAIFLQPKMYILRQNDKLIIKAKGFEKEFVNKLSYENFENALYGNKSAFRQNVMRFGKFREVLKRNNSFVGMVSRKKSIQSFYDKRKVLSNFDTSPLMIEK